MRISDWFVARFSERQARFVFERIFAVIVSVCSLLIVLTSTTLHLGFFWNQTANPVINIVLIVLYGILLALIAIKPTRDLHTIALPLSVIIWFGRASASFNLSLGANFPRSMKSELWSVTAVYTIVWFAMFGYHLVGILTRRQSDL